MKTLLIILLALALPEISFCQDTIVVKNSIHFSDKNRHKYFGKGFNAEYGREDILFSENHKRVEYCYYEDNKRNCFGKDYFILYDSTLMINDSNNIWYFKKVGKDSFFIYQKSVFYTSYGYAKSLMPLIFSSVLTSVLHKNGDTLCESQFTYTKNRPEGFSTVKPYYSNSYSKLFEYDEVDVPPLLPNGDSLPTIRILQRDYCYGEPMIANVSLMSFIVNEEGKISGIEQAIGNLDLENCHQQIYFEIACKISALGPLKPAYKSGEPVSVRWFIKVDLRNFYPQFKNHPAFEDTKENRARFIKSKTAKSK